LADAQKPVSTALKFYYWLSAIVSLELVLYTL